MRTRLDLLSIPRSQGEKMLFLTFSVYWLPTRRKLLYTVANPARGLLNRDKKKKKKKSGKYMSIEEIIAVGIESFVSCAPRVAGKKSGNISRWNFVKAIESNPSKSSFPSNCSEFFLYKGRGLHANYLP